MIRMAWPICEVNNDLMNSTAPFSQRGFYERMPSVGLACPPPSGSNRPINAQITSMSKRLDTPNASEEAMTTPTPPSARTLRLLTTALLLTLPLLACEAEYRNRGEGGDPCATDGDCAAGLSCVAFVCADGDGTYDVGVRPDARPDVTPGPDPGPDFDAGPGPDTTPPPDAALDTSSPPDASPDTGGGVCAPMERRCNPIVARSAYTNQRGGYVVCREWPPNAIHLALKPTKFGFKNHSKWSVFAHF